MAAKDPALEAILEKAREQQRANNKDPQAVTYELAELILGVTMAAQTDELEPLIKTSNTSLTQLHTDMVALINAITTMSTSLGGKIDTTNTNLANVYSRLGTMATNQTTSITLLDRIAQAVEV